MTQLQWFDAVALTAGIVTALLLIRPTVWNNEAWRATITPLASIIGSGFLVVAPILNQSGKNTPFQIGYGIDGSVDRSTIA